jgi:hypothetical protein
MPGERGWAAHAPQFGVHLHRRLQALGTESHLSYRNAPDPQCSNDYEAFLIDALRRIHTMEASPTARADHREPDPEARQP